MSLSQEEMKKAYHEEDKGTSNSDTLKILVYILFIVSLALAWINTLYGLITILLAGLIIQKKIKKQDMNWTKKFSKIWIVVFLLTLFLPVIRIYLLFYLLQIF